MSADMPPRHVTWTEPGQELAAITTRGRMLDVVVVQSAGDMALVRKPSGRETWVDIVYLFPRAAA